MTEYAGDRSPVHLFIYNHLLNYCNYELFAIETWHESICIGFIRLAVIRIKRHGIGTTHKKHCRQATATDVLTHIYLHTYEFLLATFILYSISII